MAKKLWFGIPETKMQWVPMPLIDSDFTRSGFVETSKFENGGGDARRSAAHQKVYEFNLTAPYNGSEGLNVYNKFASGFYGSGLIQFADPYCFESNMFPAHWASPGLIESGWPNIYTVDPTYANTASNSYDQPTRTATWHISGSVATAPTETRSTVTVPVPPDYTLHFGASGSATGHGVVYYQTIAADGTLGTPTALTLLSATSSTRMNASVAGSSAVAVRFFLGRTSSSSSTISITSMMAQLWPTGVSPTLTGSHIAGEGHTGLIFTDDARTESYVYIDPPRKSLSTTLLEVGAWRP